MDRFEILFEKQDFPPIATAAQAYLNDHPEVDRDSLFTFLDNPAVPFDNNRAEREIRPAMIARKNSFHNTIEKGADTHAMLMSVYRALKLRGLDPIETIADALGMFIATGKLPSLPSAKPPD